MESRKLTCLAAAAFVSSMLVIGATAHAAPQSPVVVQGKAYIDPETQRVVHYGDLNLADYDSRKALVHRVGYAVDDLCQVQLYTSTDPGISQDTRICIKTAWDSANPQIAAAFERAQSGAFVAATAVTISVR